MLRRKDHRRPNKSPPPPAPLNFFLGFPPSSTDMATSPAAALDTSAYIKVDQTKLAAQPRATRLANDLRNRLDQRRAKSAGTASALDTTPPRGASDLPPAAPAPPQAPRTSVLRRLALPPPSAEAAAAAATTLRPRAPRPSTARPLPPPTAAPGEPRRRASNAKKRRKRRILQFAQLLLETLPAQPIARRHETLSGTASAGRPPTPPALAPTSPRYASPPGLPAAALLADRFPLVETGPTTAARSTCVATPPTPRPAAAPPPPPAHLAVTLGLTDDDDILPSPDHASPPPGAGDPLSDMEISPPAGLPPPTPPAGCSSCGYHRPSIRHRPAIWHRPTPLHPHSPIPLFSPVSLDL
jgi:hypothetical protein